MLENKTIIVGVSGSIAAYKSAELTRVFKKLGADVHVIMTGNACNFIAPLTFETLTGNKCLTDSFDRNFSYDVRHISLAKRADALIIAPATANITAKIAHGLADDMLSTTALSCECPKIIAPAMNVRMLGNPATQSNFGRLRDFGYTVVEPSEGLLACGDVAKGALPPSDFLAEHVIRAVFKKDLACKKMLVTAGPTCEYLDPVRFISNGSTGKMGYAVARAAMLRGADVTLVTGKTNIQKPFFTQIIQVTSAAEMFAAVKNLSAEQDFIVKAAAVSDYRPTAVSEEKIKSGGENYTLEMTKNADILEYLGKNKRDGQVICGFSMETSDLVENSRAKLHKKDVDMIAANNLNDEGAGFACDTNKITLITKNEVLPLPLMSKHGAAMQILDMMLKL